MIKKLLQALRQRILKLIFDKNGKIFPSVQFLFFAFIFSLILAIGNTIAVGIIMIMYGLKTFTALAQANTTAPHFVMSLWILQTAGTTLPVLITPLYFARFVVNDNKEYIKPNFKFPWVLMLLVLVIMFISSPVIEFLSNINQKMILPHFLQWMRNSEDATEKMVAALLQMKTIWDMLFDLVFVGLLTAIAEEFMFRGCLQTIFERWFKNTHAAIWVAAILFSAIHMEFFGFLPRLMLGAMFGYFVAWSGSVWPAVWAHFLNNGTAVVATYLYQQKTTKLNPDDQHIFNYQWYAFSFIIILFLFWVYHNIANKKPVQV